MTAPIQPESSRDGTSDVTAWFSTRIGGVLVPLAATVLAFLIGGLVVMWPQAERRRQSGYATELRPAAPELAGVA